MKKFLAILMTLVLMLSLAVPAMAVGDGKITIDNAVKDQTYTIYKIFDLESFSGENYAYKIANTSPWYAFVTGTGAGADYVTIDAQGYVTWTAKEDDATAAAFAKAAQAYAKTKSISNQGEKIAVNATVEFTGLDLGYYLVDTTLGTLCSLNTTDKEVTIKEKNVAPVITKKVEEDSNNFWGETNDADINQVVNFKATITVQKGAENYILHDTMSTGLTYNGVTSVKSGNTAVTAANYQVIDNPTDSCTFEVKFDNAYITSLPAGTEIVVEYSATLNENAVVGLDGNTNKVKLQYGDENKPSYTPEDTTVTYTWDAKVVKYTQNGATEVMLADATFKLSTDNAATTVLKLHNLGDNKYEVCAKGDCGENHVTEITTDATGIFNIEGLDSGTYYLTETAAPAGYNKLANPVTIEITGATTGDDDKLIYSTVETKVLNQSGTELPETGGMGTTIFYIVGGVMVVAAVVLLITKKRMGTEG